MQRKKILNRFGRTGNIAPSSFRSVFVQNIGAAPTLYSTQKPCGMTSVGTGFTLIELLVVVLIIGILAAVALPQYQKAVDKARYTQAITLAENVWQAEQRYKLANGVYTRHFDELDIDVPVPVSTTNDSGDVYVYKWGQCRLHSANYVACTIKLGSSGSVWYFAMHDSLSRSCWADPTNNKRANEFCQAMTKKSTGSPNGTQYMTYAF